MLRILSQVLLRALRSSYFGGMCTVRIETMRVAATGSWMTDCRSRIIRFRVRCGGKGSPSFCVRIFADKQTMRAWASRENPDKTARYGASEASVHAYTRSRLVHGRWQRQADTGWIVFHMGHMGAGIVSHEMTHAALRYLQFWRPQLHRRLQTSPRADECLAWVQGWLVAQFWRKFYRANGGTVKATGSYSR